MAEAVDLASETDRLEETLHGMEVSKYMLSTRFQSFSEASKDAVVERFVSDRPAPLLGRVLARLPYIETPQNHQQRKGEARLVNSMGLLRDSGIEAAAPR